MHPSELAVPLVKVNHSSAVILVVEPRAPELSGGRGVSDAVRSERTTGSQDASPRGRGHRLVWSPWSAAAVGVRACGTGWVFPSGCSIAAEPCGAPATPSRESQGKPVLRLRVPIKIARSMKNE